MRILIVDDDFVSRKLLLKILEDLGECDTACNGVEAWQAFNSGHAENQPYHLILLDIMMPEMDGREVLKRIRGCETEKGLLGPKAVRIAMATTKADKDSVIKSFHDQCDGYITKPYSRESLLENLRKYGLLPAA